MNQQDSIISIFHQVSADISGRANVSGALLLVNKDNELNFIWREYKNPKIKDKNEIRLPISNILKIMINHQEKEAYLLIIAKPSQMYQFSFQSSASYQLINFIQVLTLYEHSKLENTASIEDLINFSLDSFSQNAKNFCLFDMNVVDSKIQLLPDFCIPGFECQVISTVQPDLHIISQFGVKSEEFLKYPISVEELDKFPNMEDFKEAVKVRGIAPEARHLIWPILFGILPFDKEGRKEILAMRTKEYCGLRDQWKTMSKTQLKYFSLVKDAFATIRVDVKRTHPAGDIANYPDWDQVLISVLRTFSIWNLDVRYTQGLNDLALNFVTIFLPGRGNAYTADECESLIFWCFAAFVELISSGLIAENMMDMQFHEMKEILNIITHFHPGCADWLHANNLNDLSFMISSFILAYGRSFESSVVARIWESLVSVKAPWLFMRYFSASIIILSFPSFIKIPNCSSGKLVSLMDQVFYYQDVGAVIGVSLSMMKNSQHEVVTAINEKVHIPDVQSTSLMFQPLTIYDESYKKYPDLFY